MQRSVSDSSLDMDEFFWQLFSSKCMPRDQPQDRELKLAPKTSRVDNPATQAWSQHPTMDKSPDQGTKALATTGLTTGEFMSSLNGVVGKEFNLP